MHQLSIIMTQWSEHCPFEMVPQSDFSHLEVHGQLSFSFGTCLVITLKGARNKDEPGYMPLAYRCDSGVPRSRMTMSWMIAKVSCIALCFANPSGLFSILASHLAVHSIQFLDAAAAIKTLVNVSCVLSHRVVCPLTIGPS